MALKVLLADDSMTAQNMGKKILADAGFEVATVSNGAAAIKKVAEYKPNIIILDIYMPGYTGLEVCERVRATDSTVPVLLTVGKLEPFRQEDVDHVQADAIIVKPFEATELINTVQKFADQAGVAASKAAVPPPAPAVELPPPPPPAQLSDEDLAFLRGEVPEQVPAEPAEPASNAGHAAAANPDFADLLAAPQTPVSYTEANVALNDFELPPLTEEDFNLLQDAPLPAAPAHVEAPVSTPSEINLIAPEVPQSAPAQPEAAVEPASAELPVFQLDESLTATQGEVPAVSVYDAPLPPAPAPVLEMPQSAPVAEAAMATVPELEPAPPEVHSEPAFVAEPVFTAETGHAAAAALAPEPEPEFALDLSTETPAATPEPAIEPILEPTSVAMVGDVPPPSELEPLELEQSGPQPTSDVVLTDPDLAPACEFIGATGTTPADTEIEAVTALPLTPVEPEPEHQVFEHEAVLDLSAAAVPVAAVAAISHYDAEPELASEAQPPALAQSEPAAPSIPLDTNYATVAGVVHRVFDRYRSQMIADIVRELSQQK